MILLHQGNKKCTLSLHVPVRITKCYGENVMDMIIFNNNLRIYYYTVQSVFY